ncbi:MAG TPA: hypothetical protein VM098_09170 [Phycisphaerae bacterium]|nr:hypothetical protein [Phycisphaerae bacterium]
MTRTILLAGAAVALVAGAGGCILVEKAEYLKFLQQAAKSQGEIQKLKESQDGLQAVVIDQQKQIRTLQALGPKRLEKMYHVTAIQLGRYTGGIDTDAQGGHDAIKVYLAPVDQDGSTIKAAGDVAVQLYDLAEPAGGNLIGEYKWPVDKLSGQWSGGIITYHYSFVCPWKNGPPKHDEITVRVKFVDYLTGKTFTAQKLCKVNLPGAKAQGTAPVPPPETSE